MVRAKSGHILKWLTAACLLVGTLAGLPARADAQDCASTYVVQPGDSWSRISRATGIYIRPLAAANGMTRDSELHPGMELCVPPAGPGNSPRPAAPGPTTPPAPPATTIAPPAPSTPPASPAGCQDAYRVRSGDSWSRIAKRLGTSAKRLAAANGTTIDGEIHPGDLICPPTGGASPPPPGTPPSTPPPPPTPAPPPPEGSCEAVLANYRRVLCMDLSERRAIIGGRNGVTHEFRAVAGYGSAKDCARTFAGKYFIRLKQQVTPRRKLKWGMSFGGGCVGDQIVHAVGEATMASARGTEGCIGLLEADAKTAYDTMRVGDPIVVVD